MELARTASTSGIIFFADVNEGIASVEATHNYFAVKYGKETGGILASGNHHQFLDYNITGSWSKERKPNGYKSSWIRTGRMWDLLRENHGEIDFEKVVSFTKDTANGSAPGIGGYDSICRYEERDMKEKCPGFTPDTYEKGTCRAMIIQPKERVIWWCGAHPVHKILLPLQPSASPPFRYLSKAGSGFLNSALPWLPEPHQSISPSSGNL